MLIRVLPVVLLSPLIAFGDPVSFNRDVLPILSDKCFHCHGPDGGKRKAGLRLDREADAKKVRDGHAAIVEGKTDASELVKRILSKDRDDQMPPKNSGRELTKEQADILRRWIAEGAKWEKHWAFVPPVRPTPPIVKTEWARNPIDRFILDRIEKAGLKPSPETDRATLARRMSFDLNGLPPTPEMVDAFVRDTSPDAVERFADRLMNSPRFGERMSWRWLEAARYADTNGYQTDAERDMWRWRDWVIEAYNRNLPFDQFTIEQLAGDMLPRPTLDQRIATGFNRNHRGNAEGGIVPEEYAAEYVADRVETTSTVWLGLTIGCARCHDHKYDPFTQREFYQLFAMFNNVPEQGRAVKYGNSPPYIQAPTREQMRTLETLLNRVSKAEDGVRRMLPSMAMEQKKWEVTVDAKSLGDWRPSRGLVAHLSFDQLWTLKVENGRGELRDGVFGKAVALDGKGFVKAGNIGDFGFDDAFSFSMWIKPSSNNGAILSRMAEEENSDGYGIHLVDGKIRVHLTKRWLDDALRVKTKGNVELNRWQHVVVTYDGRRLAAGVRIFVDSAEQEKEVLLDELNQSFANKEPLRIGSGGGETARFQGEIDELAIYSRAIGEDEIRTLSAPRTSAEILTTGIEKRSLAEKAKLQADFIERSAPKSLREDHRELLAAKLERDRFRKSLPTVMVMEEMAKPRETHVLLRGQYDRPGEKVKPAAPTEIAAGRAVPNRLELAKWLVSPENPLTARVAVNRLWQMCFGTGIVKTVEDFGTQGEFPSHPELLDWLATEFIRTGWDVKAMLRLIVTSATYRQQSAALLASDTGNRLLSRFPRNRLGAEMIRDAALFASGLLVEREGGPSVKPYQPAGLWNELSGVGDYVQDTGENLYRRSLYTYWKRTAPPPGLSAFDAFARETCWVRESRTNTPLQALTLLNDITYVEAARKLAERCMNESTNVDGRITLAFRRLLSRPPSETEARVLRRAFDRQLAEFEKNPGSATKLLGVGEAKRDPKWKVEELAAYASVCRLILNLDEAVTRE